MLTLASSISLQFRSDKSLTGTHVSSMLPTPQTQKCPVLCIFKQTRPPTPFHSISKVLHLQAYVGPCGNGTLPRRPAQDSPDISTTPTRHESWSHTSLVYMCGPVRTNPSHGALPKTRQTYPPHPPIRDLYRAQSSKTDQRSCTVLGMQCASSAPRVESCPVHGYSRL
jgi:hypothetical protein